MTDVTLTEERGSAEQLSALFVDDPEATVAWAGASRGQRRLATLLNHSLAEHAIVLHDRTMHGTQLRIDHVVVAPTGIWVIDARDDIARIESHDLGTDEYPDRRLFVGGRDATRSVGTLEDQVGTVRRALEPIGFGGAPVTSAVCFTDADFSLGATPFRIDGVWVSWAKRLTQLVLEQRLFSADAIKIVGNRLDAVLPHAD